MKFATLLALAGALLAGFVVAIQPGINGQLAGRLGSPLRAAVVSFGVGCTCLTLLALVGGHGLPRPTQLSGAPPWLYLGGGIVGAFFVTTALVVAPRIGATYWVALVIAGQMASSVLLDHNGWLGFQRAAASPSRILGVLLILAGVVLVARR